ncbi:hypothetical protein NPIL_370681 [Nephila pilipes]|uniref:Uncharacterized protein n=1 Tax=Nephila pilipes TaxID=299642 RepID=A0A8X6PRK9_NEPPI|nr:hypothetical protein NPIL_370681 [Nephila pilipes]
MSFFWFDFGNISQNFCQFGFERKRVEVPRNNHLSRKSFSVRGRSASFFHCGDLTDPAAIDLEIYSSKLRFSTPWLGLNGISSLSAFISAFSVGCFASLSVVPCKGGMVSGGLYRNFALCQNELFSRY